MAEELLYFNGVNGATGDYGLPPMSGSQVAAVIKGEPDEAFLKDLKWRSGQKDARHFGVTEGVDANRLDEAGWGVIFAHNADPALCEALSPLLKLRENQAGERFRVYERGDGFRVGKDNKTDFLRRHSVGPGPVDPAKVPYYLLIVGSPEEIPYRFQSQIDVQFAVGRIDFGSDLDAYQNYAQSVVAAETGGTKLPRSMGFFGVSNEDDAATRLSSEHLIAPLVAHVGKEQPGWEARTYLKDGATKADLTRLLGGEDTPSLLFTASHGMEFPAGDPRQLPHQGALLCQDWPGPKAWRGHGSIPQDHYFAADDLPANANLLGLMGFFFACYGGGTPRLDEFAKQAFKDQRAEIAPHAFLANLPTRMLANPGGGALAVVGHVERAWGCSFVWQGAGAQTAVFESALDCLLQGQTVGAAIEYFNERYAELATVLSDELEEMEYGKMVDPYDLAGMWTANNDARGYMIMGDPAVRLPLAGEGEEVAERPRIELKSNLSATGAPATVDSSAVDSATVDSATSFGLFGGSKDPATPSAPGPFQEFLGNLGGFLAKTLADVATLEVDTWVSSEAAEARYQDGVFTGASLRASTRVSMDGDTKLCVPRGADGKLDKELWEIHCAAVNQAQEARAQLIRTAIEAGKDLVGLWSG